MGNRVVVGLSGGVDSSVAARLLLDQGYDVIGVFMRNWHDESVVINNECPWVDDSNDAMMVAEHLGIPFTVLDLSEQYRERIVNYMFAEYERGRTPNPDVLCNREIKFDLFLKAALELKADYVATGHYCRKETIKFNDREIHRLLAGKDPGKDQSYFLCQLTQSQLQKALFPIGHLLKSEVRKIATDAGLPTAGKKDSQGLCFVGKVKLPVFLQQQLKTKEGRVIEIPFNHPMYLQERKSDDEKCAPFDYMPEDGRDIGVHNGAHFYTIGQRKGLNIGGFKNPLFVIDIDTVKNIVYVGEGEDHPGLNRQGLSIPTEDISWIREDLEMKPGEEREYSVRIRYRQPLTTAVLKRIPEGMQILFAEKQKGIAKGQFAAWYDGEELLGSGVIA